MLMTGEAYRTSLRDGRQVWINGERVQDVPSHPLFKPIVDVRARIYDMAHEDAYRPVMTYSDQANEAFNIGAKLPTSQQDWHAKRAAVEAGTTGLWHKYVGLDGCVIGLDRFGESAPGGVLFKHFGFTAQNIADKVAQIL